MSAKQQLRRFVVFGMRGFVAISLFAAVLATTVNLARFHFWEALGMLISLGWVPAVYAVWHFRGRWVPRVRAGTAKLRGVIQ